MARQKKSSMAQKILQVSGLLMIISMLISSAGFAASFDFTCTDTDSGKDTYAKGTVTIFGSKYVDYCYNGKNVWEYYCNIDKISKKEGLVQSMTALGFTCKYGCLDGACLPTPSTDKCSDSDAGYDVYKKGIVTTPKTAFTDSCIDTKTIKEYSCFNNQVHSSVSSCPLDKTCRDGFCLPASYEQVVDSPTCLDSDGTDQFTKGITATHFGSLSDYCYGATNKFVWEYSCNGNQLQSYGISCQNSCNEGKCD